MFGVFWVFWMVEILVKCGWKDFNIVGGFLGSVLVLFVILFIELLFWLWLVWVLYVFVVFFINLFFGFVNGVLLVIVLLYMCV